MKVEHSKEFLSFIPFPILHICIGLQVVGSSLPTESVGGHISVIYVIYVIMYSEFLSQFVGKLRSRTLVNLPL